MKRLSSQLEPGLEQDPVESRSCDRRYMQMHIQCHRRECRSHARGGHDIQTHEVQRDDLRAQRIDRSNRGSRDRGIEGSITMENSSPFGIVRFNPFVRQGYDPSQGTSVIMSGVTHFPRVPWDAYGASW